jgi:hypothetical protein
MDLSNILNPDNMGDIVGYANSIDLPPAIKKSLWKAIGDLVAGAVDVPVAYFESKSQQIRTEAQALSFVTKKASEAAAKKFKTDEELVERAINHFGGKLFKEQINREKITAKAIDELKNDPPTQDSDSEIDEDWLSMFSRIAEQKSNADVQLFLAKILAGEIRKPGSYSPQTIQILSTLSQNVARIFQSFCDVSFSQGLIGVAWLITDPFGQAGGNGLSSLGLSYGQLTMLQDAGLIQHDLNAWRDIPPVLFMMPFDIGGRNYQMIQADQSEQNKIQTQRRVTMLNFTESGQQLRSVLHLGTNSDYEAKILEWLKTQFDLIPMVIK